MYTLGMHFLLKLKQLKTSMFMIFLKHWKHTEVKEKQGEQTSRKEATVSPHASVPKKSL